ncbi:ComEC/Rec2 family competence protein [Nocardioides acrostichi]|uniref:ComEC/Rec2 family competence protein n=1 Tax=Nocardioides acrostichi TaxID=2784339 RepID=A0A930V523_9ACTN|nr:ComEC/Rec2 family competence protein [Nocardioides acrostichi]MBF4163324.1 ComEC/Rec2 family competence protein [Nocardioides acrostichi]
MPEQRASHDVRTPLLGLAAWAGGLAAASLDARWAMGTVLGLTLLLALGARLPALRARVRRPWPVVLALSLVMVAVAVSALLRTELVTRSPVHDLADEHAHVQVVGTVTSDPRPVTGMFSESVSMRLRVEQVDGRGVTWRLASPVLVIGDPAWGDVPIGTRVRAEGRLTPARDDDLSGVLLGAPAPEVVTEPDVWWRASGAVRASLRESVAHRPEPERILVPALVSGDDAGLDEGVADDFRATGLTHLLAVSGTNLTLVVGFLLLAARWLGVRGRWLLLVGALGICGFVLLARTEPSVLRAATMGAVGLVALSRDGPRRSGGALGVAVLVLLLLDPRLATSVGFALSVLATAGIVWLAPPWRDALVRWMPRWAAEALAVPIAAQLACTPVVAAISGQVSLAAVMANLAAAPVVAPATVLGLLGGLVGLVLPPVGRALGWLASWCVTWIVAVAEHGAALPTAAIGWGTGPWALLLLTVLTVAAALLGPRVVGRPLPACLLAGVLVVVIVVRPPTPSWPLHDWVLVACDVGQGDALALRAGPSSAVVIDTGREPEPVDACLRGLGVRDVPLLVLTHFHADHVSGIEGVLDGRHVEQVLVTTDLDPTTGVAEVEAAAREAGVPMRAATALGEWQVGDVRLRSLWPAPGAVHDGPGDGSTANDASIVLLAEVDGLRILLTGDVEPPGQEAIAQEVPDLSVDVLKVPHHGSRYQDESFLTGLRARLALVSVGADNDYGHPNEPMLDDLRAAGMRVYRTDLDGSIAVGLEDGQMVVATDGH